MTRHGGEGFLNAGSTALEQGLFGFARAVLCHQTREGLRHVRLDAARFLAGFRRCVGRQVWVAGQRHEDPTGHGLAIGGAGVLGQAGGQAVGGGLGRGRGAQGQAQSECMP